MRRLTLLLALVAALATASTAPAAPAAAWTQHRSAGGGFVVSTPASWIDFSSASASLLEKLRSDPQVGMYVDLVRQNKALKLFAVDTTPSRLAGGFATNLNVLQTPGADAKLQVRMVESQLRGLGVLVGKLRTDSLRVPAGKAWRLRYQARFSGAPATVSVTQFLLVHARRTSVFTYSTRPSQEPAYRATFTRSIRSLRWTS